MLNFDFLEKGLGIVSPPHFAYDFSRKMFHVIFYYLNKFHWLIDYLYLSRYWLISVLQFYVNSL